MPVLTCPVCGCEAAECSQQKTLAAPQSVDQSEAEALVCHCARSHRFVVSLDEQVLARAGTSERHWA
jgi:hypothetical protein